MGKTKIRNKQVQMTLCDRSFTTLFLLNLFVHLKLIMILFIEAQFFLSALAVG